MTLTIDEIWFGLARAISSADGAVSKSEYVAAARAGQDLLGIEATGGTSPWESHECDHAEICSSFEELCTQDAEARNSILVGLVHIAQADGEVCPEEAALMWRIFHLAGMHEEGVVAICERAQTMRSGED